MKKTIVTLFSFLLFAPSALAATVVTEFSVDFDQNESKELAPMNITSTVAGDITAQHGIHLILGATEQILWQKSSLIFSGKAVDTGKVDASPQYKYSQDYKSLFIPVKQDFAVTDNLRITGLKLKAYEDQFNDRYIGMDLNGDLVPDINDINSYEVTFEVLGDKIPAYPITNLTHTINQDGSIKLTWSIPPDYDYAATVINRTRVKGGFPMLSTVYNDYGAVFTDNDLKDVTSVSYSIVTADTGGNWSEPVVLEIDLTTPQTPEEPQEPQIPEEPETPPTEDNTDPELEKEIAGLEKLLNYYRLRYQIACMPSGVPVHPDDSRCLWARIDLIYAQELTGNVLVQNLSLSERDLYLMSVRRKFPEMRYKNNCVETQTPADYCTSLGKAVKRISYFLD